METNRTTRRPAHRTSAAYRAIHAAAIAKLSDEKVLKGFVRNEYRAVSTFGEESINAAEVAARFKNEALNRCLI